MPKERSVRTAHRSGVKGAAALRSDKYGAPSEVSSISFHIPSTAPPSPGLLRTRYLAIGVFTITDIGGASSPGESPRRCLQDHVRFLFFRRRGFSERTVSLVLFAQRPSIRSTAARMERRPQRVEYEGHG